MSPNKKISQDKVQTGKFEPKQYGFEEDAPLYVLFAFLFILFCFVWNLDNIPILGTVGDWFGGTLNPLIALLALFGLSRSIKIQRQALKEARDGENKQLKIQSKQLSKQTFFDLLSLRANAVAGVTWKAGFSTLHGRSAIKFILERIVEESNKQSKIDLEKIQDAIKFLGFPEKAIDIPEKSQKCIIFFAACYINRLDLINPPLNKRYKLEELETELGHIFRATYQILKFVYECEDFNPSEKLDLANYLRAQMSEPEFALYALTGCNEVGKKSRAVSIAFDLFENRLYTIKWATDIRILFDPKDFQNKEFAENLEYPLLEKNADKH